MARKHPLAMNLRVGHTMQISLSCAIQNHKSMPESSPFLTPWILWEIFLHSLICSLWNLLWACSSALELLSICKKIRNENTGKKIKRRAWCQCSRAIIMGLFLRTTSVFVSQVKTSEHFITYSLEETGEWNAHLVKDQPCFFSQFCVFQVAVSQRAVPECCLMLPLQPSASTTAKITHYTPDIPAEGPIKMLKPTCGNKILLISFYQHSK